MLQNRENDMPEGAQPTFVERVKQHPLISTLAIAGGLLLGACGESNNETAKIEMVAESATATTDGAANEAASTTTDTTDGRISSFNERQPAVPMSDEELAEGGYNCGKGLENFNGGEFSYDSQIDYLNADPELANNLVDFNINDSEYGMGQEAWDFLLEKGAINPNTDEDKKLASAGIDNKIELDRHLHQTMRAAAHEPRDFINFTCEGEEGEDGIRPVGIVRVAEGERKNAYDGIVLTGEDLLKFVSMAENPERFAIVPLGEQELVLPNGRSIREQAFMVVTSFDGCRNPARLPLAGPEQPGEPTEEEETPPPPTTPGTNPPTTPPTLPPTTTTTEAPDKNPDDDYVQPDNTSPNNGGSSGGQPGGPGTTSTTEAPELDDETPLPTIDATEGDTTTSTEPATTCGTGPGEPCE